MNFKIIDIIACLNLEIQNVPSMKIKDKRLLLLSKIQPTKKVFSLGMHDTQLINAPILSAETINNNMLSAKNLHGDFSVEDKRIVQDISTTKNQLNPVDSSNQNETFAPSPSVSTLINNQNLSKTEIYNQRSNSFNSLLHNLTNNNTTVSKVASSYRETSTHYKDTINNLKQVNIAKEMRYVNNYHKNHKQESTNLYTKSTPSSYKKYISTTTMDNTNHYSNSQFNYASTIESLARASQSNNKNKSYHKICELLTSLKEIGYTLNQIADSKTPNTFR